MLNKEVFFKGMEDLVSFFPNWNVEVEEVEVMKKWYGIFSKYNDESFKKMIEEYISNEAYQPTVAGLKKYYKCKSKLREIKQDFWRD